MLFTGIPQEFLSQELGFGSSMTAKRRLQDSHQAGIWQQLHENLLAGLNAADALDWPREVTNGSHVRALKGGPNRASPVPAPEQARTRLITEGRSIPLAASLTG
ncbi:hypothetical protein [Lentzea albidocapillata]|uniref:Uncharacterized protein n=1 Tax=Lentzea albidocapillata TaxID=40571 RepID=A0A1W2FTE3_9PSEU|nr:hypothetical protein [Lentzea albidocapillata]SMD25201.1 hypothetical protein SAMN05660733_08040 [Lentzea albidocapillata]